jgi:hypothetical protein
MTGSELKQFNPISNRVPNDEGWQRVYTWDSQHGAITIRRLGHPQTILGVTGHSTLLSRNGHWSGNAKLMTDPRFRNSIHLADNLGVSIYHNTSNN